MATWRHEKAFLTHIGLALSQEWHEAVVGDGGHAVTDGEAVRVRVVVVAHRVGVLATDARGGHPARVVKGTVEALKVRGQHAEGALLDVRGRGDERPNMAQRTAQAWGRGEKRCETSVAGLGLRATLSA